MASEFVCIESSDVTIDVDASASRSWRRPVLKWAGGKYSMLPDLYQISPAGSRLMETIVGGGSVFLNPEKHAGVTMADVDNDLNNIDQMLACVPVAGKRQHRG
ncbi:DNA adenine methylase, partial [Salmonella enterica]|uniref:DNA adenine methylase n=1 Tax=Salmonella enterica TaxID=28901 RepID=UPI00398C52BA